MGCVSQNAGLVGEVMTTKWFREAFTETETVCAYKAYACLFCLTLAWCGLQSCRNGQLHHKLAVPFISGRMTCTLQKWKRGVSLSPYKCTALFRAKHRLKGTGPLRAATGLTFAEHSFGLYGKCALPATAASKPTSLTGLPAALWLTLPSSFTMRWAGFPAEPFTSYQLFHFRHWT